MIVVTAPTGMIGQQVLGRLLGENEQVRVVVRDSQRLPEFARERVDVVVGSHGDPAVVDQAFDGAEALFWLLPPYARAASVDDAYVGFTRAAAAALPGSKIRHVVGVSALGRGTPVQGNAGNVTGSLAMDDLIAETGVSYRALTMPSFMDNIARQAGLIKDQGLFTSPIRGDLLAPSAATRDIAEVAAKLLTDRNWAGATEVPVLGPEDVSFEMMAEIMSEVLDTPVRFQQVTPDAYKERMLGFGMSDAMAQGMLDMAMAKQDGLDNAVRRTPENSTPTTFRSWCEDVLVHVVRS